MSWRVDPVESERFGGWAALSERLTQWRSFGLGPRLASVAEHVPQGRVTADVGADHALLLAALLERAWIPKGWVVELNQAPLEAARATLERRGLSDRAVLCLGDGFQPLSKTAGTEQVTCACLCGVGGALAARLLAAAPPSLEMIIFQVNHGHGQLRVALQERGWLIQGSSLVFERGRLFLNLVAARASGERPPPHGSGASSAHPLLEVDDLLSGDPLAPLWARTLRHRLRHRLQQSVTENQQLRLRDALAFLEKSALFGLLMFP